MTASGDEMIDERAAPQLTPRASSPLDGVRVLDFSHILAGPFCTRLLADLGAEVLKVETATRPDRTAVTRPDPNARGRQDRPPAFLNTNRNKRSITLNLKTDAGRSLATRLASVADIIVENFSAGVMGRLELDYERLSPLNPGLIYVSMAGYGHSGPRQDWTSMNMNLQAYTGLMMTTGAEGDAPTAISNSWNDYIGGLHACFGVLQALSERRVTGLGANLDLAQFECSVATLAPLLVASAINGVAPPRLGSRSARAAPQGVYRCAGGDDWCAISVQDDEQWAALAAAMGRPAWAKDPRFDTLVGRLRHHDEIDAAIEVWTSSMPNMEVERCLKTAGVAAERMRRIREVVEDSERHTVFRPLEDPPGHRMLVTGVPFSFSRSAVASPSPAAALGADTEDALREWLGLGPEDVRTLEAEAALV